MTASGLLKTELYLNGAWVDVSADVMSATWSRGRTSVRQDWMVGGATIVVYDPDRDYDPLNTSGAHTGFLTGGAPVRVSVRQDAGDAWTIMFTGYVDRFVPESWGGDSAASTTIECNGKLFGLTVPMPNFPHDLISERLSNARAGCFYTFAFANDAAGDNFAGGYVEDVSGRGTHGVSYTDEDPTPTVGISTPTAGALNMQGDGSVVAPLPPDPVHVSSEGFLFVASVTLDGGNWGPWSDYVRWAIFGEGVLDDRIRVYLEETVVTPSTPAGTDPMTLIMRVTDNASLVVDSSLSVGTRADWVNKTWTVAWGADHEGFYLCAADEAGGLILSAGANNPFRGVAGGQPAPTWTGSRLTRFGRTYLAPAQLPGWSGNMHTAAAAYVATSYAEAARVVAAAWEYGWVPSSFADRVDKFVDLAGIDAGDLSATITSTVQHSEFAPVSDRTALELLREMVTMEHGKLFQGIGGDVVVEDFVAGGARGRVSQATWSDQTGETLRYRDGTAPITTAVDEIVNRVTVKTPTGHQATVTDSASVAAYGLRSVSVSLPFASNADALRFAELMVARFKTPRPHIAEATVDPDSNPDGWWPQLVARDIGDRVTVERQPLGVGSVASVPSIIEGDRWVWSSEFGFAVTYFFSHAETLGGQFYLDSSSLDGPYVLG